MSVHRPSPVENKIRPCRFAALRVIDRESNDAVRYARFRRCSRLVVVFTSPFPRPVPDRGRDNARYTALGPQVHVRVLHARNRYALREGGFL